MLPLKGLFHDENILVHLLVLQSNKRTQPKLFTPRQGGVDWIALAQSVEMYAPSKWERNLGSQTLTNLALNSFGAWGYHNFCQKVHWSYVMKHVWTLNSFVILWTKYEFQYLRRTGKSFADFITQGGELEQSSLGPLEENLQKHLYCGAQIQHCCKS